MSEAPHPSTAPHHPLLPRTPLDMAADPDDVATEDLMFSHYEQLPLVLLIVGDFTGSPDMRPVEDRRPAKVTPKTFDERLARSKLSAKITLPEHGDIVLRFRRLSDFDDEPLRQQISSAAAAAGLQLDPAQLSAAIEQARSDPHLRARESAWRSLHQLMTGAPDNVVIEYLNCSEEDLVMDFEDTPDLYRCGLWRVTHQYNHYGIRPFAAVVVDMPLCHNRYLATQLGDLARACQLIILTNAADPETSHEDRALAAWRHSAGARFVARCSPAAQLTTDSGRTIPVSAAMTAAALLAQSLGHYRCGHQLHAVGAPSLSIPEALPPDAAAARAASGHLVLGSSAEGVRVLHANSCHRPLGGGHHSLEIQLLVTRLLQQISNIQWRKVLRAKSSPYVFLKRINEGLATRLAPFPWLEARIDSPVKVASGRHHLLRFDVTIWLQPAEGTALTLAESIQLDPER